MVLLNYANNNFLRAQKRNTRSGWKVAGFDAVISRGPEDIDAKFWKENEQILSQEKGGGLWLWKPYWILRTLSEMADGEWLFYCDAGAYFIQPIAPLVAHLSQHPQDVYPFELYGLTEAVWTKPEVLEAIAPHKPDIWQSSQRLGGFHLWKATDRSRSFAKDWLELTRQPKLLTDGTESSAAIANGFKEHRHDQSIFSVLSKVHGYRSFRDPSQYGNRVPGFDGQNPYPQTIQLTRDQDLPPLQELRRSLSRLLRK